MSCRIHLAQERGIAEHGWLHSRFSFSFAEYHNPYRMGFGTLRVINDDVIEAGKGFGMHPHRDMEIITIMMEGKLMHEDSMGNRGVIEAGQIQYMSAGSGIMHSEYAGNEGAALFQIWIFPDRKGYEPRYDQRDFSQIEEHNRWALLISDDGREGSIRIRQKAAIYVSSLDKGKGLVLPSAEVSHGRLLLVVEGSVEIEGHRLNARDEIQLSDSREYSLQAIAKTKVLLFDVVMDLIK